MNNIRLIVGLGNPGQTYQGTRHNIGFAILDKVSHNLGFTFKKETKYKGELAQYQGVLFLKPQTFMNESGRSVGPLAHFLKLTPEQILIVHDENAFDCGRFKFKMGGSANGHNGIKSIIASLGGSQNFPRLRFGIGKSRPGEQISHVLGKFSPEERIFMENGLDKAAEAVQFVLSQGVELAANRYNVNEI